MHFVVHAKREKLLNHPLKPKTLFLLPDPKNYFILIYLDQLAMHPYMEVTMD